MKGIILAGGQGSRLHPLTLVTSKQLLPVYDKPMIYYPLSVLMQAGIKEILIISSPYELPRFKQLFAGGSHLGLDISYIAQERPEGIAQAFLLAEAFIGSDDVCLILGDNIFYGDHLQNFLSKSKMQHSGASIFGYKVQDPCRYGVIQFDEHKKPVGIFEKPKTAPSSYAVTGLYFYDNQVVDIAKTLMPSNRGELEITDVNNVYLKQKMLDVHLFDKGFAWLDTGTFATLAQASNFVQTIQERQGIKVACIEEIAYEMGFISEEQLFQLANSLSHSEYGKYLLKSLEGRQVLFT